MGFEGYDASQTLNPEKDCLPAVLHVFTSIGLIGWHKWSGAQWLPEACDDLLLRVHDMISRET